MSRPGKGCSGKDCPPGRPCRKAKAGSRSNRIRSVAHRVLAVPRGTHPIALCDVVAEALEREGRRRVLELGRELDRRLGRLEALTAAQREEGRWRELLGPVEMVRKAREVLEDTIRELAR